MNADRSPALPFDDRADVNGADDDRQWQAFRYVLGEMSPDESQAYEQLLADDQEARELVAASVGLVADLYRAEPIAIAHVPRRNSNLQRLIIRGSETGRGSLWFVRSPA